MTLPMRWAPLLALARSRSSKQSSLLLSEFLWVLFSPAAKSLVPSERASSTLLFLKRYPISLYLGCYPPYWQQQPGCSSQATVAGPFRQHILLSVQLWGSQQLLCQSTLLTGERSVKSQPAGLYRRYWPALLPGACIRVYRHWYLTRAMPGRAQRDGSQSICGWLAS